MRAAIYARYSSDNQREASIEDQITQCKKKIDSEDWELVDSYYDRAISGATLLRPGYQKLLEDIRSNRFDVIVSEALDRLSRDQEDVAALYKQLSFAGVTLITLSEGEISELHVGLKGTMNALFLKDLAIKTHRGLSGRAQSGTAGKVTVKRRSLLFAMGRTDTTIHVKNDHLRRATVMNTVDPDPVHVGQNFNVCIVARSSVSKRPIWLVDAACLSTALPATIHRMAGSRPRRSASFTSS